MKDEIFRKSSINRINSPDVLNEYIKVSSPSVWILIASIIVLLFGTLVWGYFGKIDSTIPLDFVVNNNGGIAIVELDEAKNVKVGMEVEIDNNSVCLRRSEIIYTLLTRSKSQTTCV